MAYSKEVLTDHMKELEALEMGDMVSVQNQAVKDKKK